MLIEWTFMRLRKLKICLNYAKLGTEFAKNKNKNESLPIKKKKKQRKNLNINYTLIC